MGILRDSPSAVRYPTLDPFEICDDLLVESPSRSTASSAGAIATTSADVRGAKATKSSHTKNVPGPIKASFIKRTRAARNYVLLCALAAAVVMLLGKTKPWSYFSQPNLVFAYFEVRALDGNGHPIAGAIVKNAGKRVGTTDSFGEWRRYMQVPLGSTIPISLTKKTANQLLFVSKNFAVPPVKQDKNEIELRSSVQLMPADPTSVDTDNEGSVHRPELIGSALVQTPESTPKVTRQLASGSLTPELHTTEQSRFDAIKSAEGLLGGSIDVTADLGSIWFSASDVRTEKEIVPALATRAKELGLKVERNAAWQIRLTSLVDRPAKMAKDGGGLILVSSAISNASRQSSAEFLRNYQSDVRTTARGILFGLMNHVNKNILLTQARGRWAAVLPKNSPHFWRLSANQTLYSSANSIKLGDESYSDETMQGFYLRDQKNIPCSPNATSCYVQTASFLEAPPVSGWRRLKLTTPGMGKDSLKVFVSGYFAKALGDNVFEYWGQERAKANATILQNGRLVFRGAVIGSSSGAAVLGNQNLSRR